MGLKAIIVDDDPNTVQMLEDSIPWDNYGITEVESAYQGMQALEIIQDRSPDIVISDIEMPQLDGIQLVEKLQKLDYSPEVIFLTCHDSFEYARKAINYGVSDYLLKPFRMDEFSAALLKVVLKCAKKQENERKLQELEIRKKETEKNQDYLIHNFVFRLLNKSIDGPTSALADIVKKRNIPFNIEEKYYLLYAGVNLNNCEIEKMSESEFYFIFQNLAKEVIYGDVSIPCVVENTLPPYYILIMPVAEYMGNMDDVRKRCDRFIQISKQYLHMNLACAVSTAVFPEEFGNIRERMDQLFLRERTDTSKVFSLEGITPTLKTEERVFHYEEALSFLRERKKTELLALLIKDLQLLNKEEMLDSIHLKAVHHNIMQLFYGFLQENHIQAYQLFQNELYRELNEKAEYSSKNMIQYCSFLYDATYEQIDFLKKEDSVVDRIKKYIEQHFRENISREDIAANIYITPNYLSRIFHEKSGLTLREYINICRIEEAKRLMSATDYSITEIALMTGFENIPYFSTVFKKYCKMAPAAYKGSLVRD